MKCGFNTDHVGPSRDVCWLMFPDNVNIPYLSSLGIKRFTVLWGSTLWAMSPTKAGETIQFMNMFRPSIVILA